MERHAIKKGLALIEKLEQVGLTIVDWDGLGTYEIQDTWGQRERLHQPEIVNIIEQAIADCESEGEYYPVSLDVLIEDLSQSPNTRR
jgi:hypothetical protein